MSSSGHPLRLLDQVRGALRRKPSSLRTAAASIGWVRRFIRVHHLRHPRAMGSRDIGAFLTCLAVEAEVAASTQNQALSAVFVRDCEAVQIARDADLSIMPMTCDHPAWSPQAARGVVRDPRRFRAALGRTRMRHLHSSLV
ncbi:site-specific integrase [Roseiflexus castenholzii]|jgi:hypothetical protein|uniref:site-specific integrase n=1 Tax=Roseiflexus castenholzii TaxID=120962 RepID=UPI0002DF6C2E|nr:site-specific integrase [Roseiflexus castenholzii]